jgi:glycosyltransferase 2 family protein
MHKLLFLLKIVISIYILYYLFSNYKLNFADIIDFNYIILLPIICLGFLIVLINSYRFTIILHAQNIKFNFLRCLRINMISSIFDIFLPSSNGGDVVRLTYILKEKNISKMGGSIAIIFDRFIGFYCLFLFLLIGLLFSDISILNEIEYIKYLALFLIVSTIVSIYIFGSTRLLLKLEQYPFLHKLRLISLFKRINLIRKNIKTLSISLMLSVASQSINLFNIAIIIFYFKQSNFDIVNFIVACSIGLIGNLFGFAGGFGAGTLAFEYTFTNYLLIENSLQIILIYQFSQILIRLIGLPIFLFGKKLK